MSFVDFCNKININEDQRIFIEDDSFITFTNRNNKAFSVKASVVIEFVKFLNSNAEYIRDAWLSVETRKANLNVYEEKSYRAIYDLAQNNPAFATITSLSGSQTRQLTSVITKVICYLAGFNFEGIDVNARFDSFSTRAALDSGNFQLKSNYDEKISHIDLEYDFKTWMISNGLSESTSDKYTRVSKKFILKLAGDDLPKLANLFYITDINNLDKLKDHLNRQAEWVAANENGNGMYDAALRKYRDFLLSRDQFTCVPKPFLLLAGISGTGKTRFIRHQAAASRADLSNYQLIPVRPDWHEPSDLLGYVTRIDGERYVPTPFLKFMAAAWRDAFESVNAGKIALRPLDEITTFWACLDEMNLAPVEQYFADYLAVLETRKWTGSDYTCDALVHPSRLLKDAASLPELQKSLGLEDCDELWQYFLKQGIPLPPNLIVAGTVNMDETTHGFSRKVIDRAFTIDFGEFFPNDFDKFFAPDKTPKTFKFSRYSHARQADFSNVQVDVDGTKTVAFLKTINQVLIGTPFEMAFRAVNELLLAVKCFAPEDDLALEAVWDDFLMTKLLPRIEGDSEKLRAVGDQSLLTDLREVVVSQLRKSLASGSRPDLMQLDVSGVTAQVGVRSLRKLDWMQERLNQNAFSTFWP